MIRPAPLPAALLSLATLCLTCGCETSSEEAADARETFEVDFAAVPPRGPVVSLTGYDAAEVTTAGPSGLSVRLPQPGEKSGQVGVEMKFGLEGDFEAEGAFRFRQFPDPDGGYGAGAGLQLNRSEGQFTMLFCGLVKMPYPVAGGAKEVWKIVCRERLPDGTTTNHHTFVPVQGSMTGGRLRMVREGGVVHCRAETGQPDVWLDLASIEFGPEPVDTLRLAADTGGPPLPLHVDLTHFSVAAARLPVGRPAETPATGPNWPLIAGGIAAAAFVLAGVIVWRQRTA